MPIFFPWWPQWKTCARWGEGAGEAESRTFVIVWDDVAFHHSLPVADGLQPIPGWCHFSIPPDYRGILFFMEVESLWSPAIRAVTFHSNFERSFYPGRKSNIWTLRSCLNSKFTVYKRNRPFEVVCLVICRAHSQKSAWPIAFPIDQ